ncbi:unnamed protein product [Brassica oleracea]|uniref:Bromo domain-containing protein n=1 Tax=Brassica oleracea TaxID=3712 RepID=A0A3P6GDB5_BRAOL|nr:unnamed protein product [Brassica oleracea]
MTREEDTAVTSNGMNDEYANNINSCSASDNNRNGDANQISQVWGTWEELLLTCAVKRHGSKDWDSVAKEVASRSSLNASAHDCRLKYEDLKRRFDDDDDGRGNTDDRDGEIVERLRSLRVAELRREVQLRDESILSLQLKVKKLEEENDGDDKPDLEAVRSLNNETEPVRLNRGTTESDHRSMNESNSTASVDKIADHERLDNSRNPDPAHKAAEEEGEATVSRRSGMSHSGELGESGTSTGTRKRTRRGQKYMSGEDRSIRGGSGGNIKTAGNKSQPLVEIIKLIRSHPRGSVFESLKMFFLYFISQETKNYKGLIRQHLDIKTIEKKMEKGSYVSSSLSFYRDLKLLFTNAIVFFPTSSSEYMAAQELKTLVSIEMKKRNGTSIHSVIKTDALSLVSRQKPSAPPLVACEKKSSALTKTLPSSRLKQKDEKKTREVSEEKTLTTAARSSRRTSNGIEVVAKNTKMGRAKNNKKQKTDSSSDDDDDGDKEETPKTEKKRAVAASEKKKSVAEFLKRIKTNSPQKVKETTSKDQKKSAGNVKKQNSKAKPRELRSNSTGKKKVDVENNSNKSSSKRKQSKKEAEEVTDAGRESGKDYQQPKKRNRR